MTRLSRAPLGRALRPCGLGGLLRRQVGTRPDRDSALDPYLDPYEPDAVTRFPVGPKARSIRIAVASDLARDE